MAPYYYYSEKGVLCVCVCVYVSLSFLSLLGPSDARFDAPYLVGVSGATVLVSSKSNPPHPATPEPKTKYKAEASPTRLPQTIS